MDKNAIKKYAVWARRELIERVSQRALRFGITADGNADPNADSVEGYLLSAVEKKQRAALIKKVEEHGYEQVLEEAAYTWFNRFAALRFMEVNGYLPSHVRVFTNEEGEFKPQILAEAIHLELDGLNMDKVYELKDANNTEELYRYLLIVQCNALSSILPGMFQRIEDYTELLLPENLLREGSVLQQMIELIPEEDWQEQVQIIGWLYQYYNTEPKDKVFADLKKNIKVTKEKIPAATQLFTPDWIVRYMVENSLGRLWLEGHPNDTLKSTWKYYLDEAEQEEEVQKQLDEIRKGYASMKPEEIKVIDPCMGSGHILCYLFDVLVQIYEDYGHTAREAVEGILTNNLYGLDIDDRAAQLAYFAVMMKARQYDRRFFSRGIQPHVMAIQETNDLERFEDVTGYPSTTDARKPLGMLERLMDMFEDAKDYGSLLKVPQGDYAKAAEFIEEGLHSDLADDLFNLAWLQEMAEIVPKLVEQANILSQKYDVVVTNPPYMGSSNMSAGLSKFVKKEYPDSKSDLFACFIERCGNVVKANGYVAMITQHAWMFLSSFEAFRKNFLKKDILNMAHLGARAFDDIGGEVVQTTSMVTVNGHVDGYKGIYARLVEPVTQDGKEEMFLRCESRFVAQQENFAKIPGSPVAYWVSEAAFLAYEHGKSFSEYIVAKHGLTTGNVNFCLRYWEEVNFQSIGFGCTSEQDFWSQSHVWAPHHKGGTFRKWYGNNDYIIGYNEFFNKKMDEFPGHRHDNPQFYFREGITWTDLTSGDLGVRYSPSGYIFDVSGPTAFIKKGNIHVIIGFMNSKITTYFMSIVNSTLHFLVGHMKQVPVYDFSKVSREIQSLVERNICISRTDWNSFETSWDFERHPLISLTRRGGGEAAGMFMTENERIENAYFRWTEDCNARFNQLKSNEEELNRIFIDIYGLGDELTPEVADKDVTVARIYDTKEEIPDSMKGNNYVLTKEDVIKSFISYAVGCMFGRYSLDVEGLVYAGGEWDDSKYKTVLPDTDAIIPICDDEYFDDDIVGRFVQFVEVVYGKDTLEENLQFIADALGSRGTSREVIRNYFVSGFYADHVKTYKKRPIYWLFDSGKKNGFKCLIYMHRYQPDTLARIRTDYIHEQQSRYRTVIESLEQRIAAAGSSSEKVKLTKLLNARQAQAKEIREYEEKVHHLADQMIKIDLDDGVKHNYAIFKDVLAKIK